MDDRKYLIILILFWIAVSISLAFYQCNTKLNKQEERILYIGVASWYGGGEKLDTKTATSEVFSPTALTCASYQFPFESILEVTNQANGKSVEVRVNDLGANKKLGRIVDLTKEAFSRIAELDEGLITVEVEIVR